MGYQVVAPKGWVVPTTRNVSLAQTNMCASGFAAYPNASSKVLYVYTRNTFGFPVLRIPYFASRPHFRAMFAFSIVEDV